MSLIGSLEDLSLGDILQIISLSQKSGVLILSGESGEGRIVFDEGLVSAAVLKGGPEDLRGVLVDRGVVGGDDFDRAADLAHERDGEIPEALADLGTLSRDDTDAECRGIIEQSVAVMFGWNRGDFSFDVRTEAEPGDPTFGLRKGINAQYLAMESARVGDETGRDAGEAADDGPEMSAHEMFGVDPDPGSDTEVRFDAGEPAGDAAEIVAIAAVESLADEEGEIAEGEEILLDAPIDEEDGGSTQEVDAPPELTADFDADAAEITHEVPIPDFSVPELDAVDAMEREQESDELPFAELEPDGVEVDEELAAVEHEPVEAVEVCEEVEAVEEAEPLDASEVVEGVKVAEPEPAVAAAVAVERPIVLIDPSLPSLEWAKRVLADHYERVHIFQSSELGLARIRQYLVRIEQPLVMISPSSDADHLSGIKDAADFVRRLKLQGARMPILWLCNAETGRVDPDPADGSVLRPSESDLTQIAAGQAEDGLAQPLLDVVAEQMTGVPRASGSPDTPVLVTGGEDLSPGALERLKEATAVLSAGASRGEVLPLVMRFASESFGRVVMFMVRDDEVLGIGQVGLEATGGPGDAELQQIRIERDECGWFRQVFATGNSVVSSAMDDGDRRLALRLGDRMASEAYVAPITSSGQIVALLYADHLPGNAPVGDTTALEVVLQHAGLALERAVLERALAEMEGEEGDARGAAGEARPETQSPPDTSRNTTADR